MKTPPPEIANLYPMSNDWHRCFPWTYSTMRRDHYETVFYRVTFDAAGTSTEHKVRVALPRSIFWNAQAALWDIANQLRKAGNAARSGDGRFAREEGRRRRPGKRARERIRAGREDVAR
jgi:hypothetical protein